MSLSQNSLLVSIPLCAALLISLFGSPSASAQSDELILGREGVEPGIQMVFEGAIKDVVYPKDQHLEEDKTDVHLEALITWTTQTDRDVPEGAVRGGHIPYLNITAKVKNERTGEKTSVDLVPHINKGDNFHYARNLNLPGEKGDTYEVRFNVNPPQKYELSYHKGYNNTYGRPLFEAVDYTYQEVSFDSVVDKTRR